ncbi:MAG: DUF507 family protein [Deltaproteobacteria bacterium]|nr:DUF507 family protein [Deltaproteobacteria bacterium]
MNLTEDRVYSIANLILTRLREKGVSFLKDEGALKKEIRNSIFHYKGLDEEIDVFVRKKLDSQSRTVQSGGREWDVLYRKYYEEEMALRLSSRTP